MTCVYNTGDEAQINRCCATLSIVQHDAVEVGLVCLSKKCLMSIQHEVDHLISRRHVEAITEPVQRHLAGCHGVEHVVLEVLDGLSHLCFVHAPIISIGFGRSLVLVCHLANWSEAADQFVLVTVQRESDNKRHHTK